MRVSNQLRILANELENINDNPELKKKEVWDMKNIINDKLIDIIDNDKIFIE